MVSPASTPLHLTQISRCSLKGWGALCYHGTSAQFVGLAHHGSLQTKGHTRYWTSLMLGGLLPSEYRRW